MSVLLVGIASDPEMGLLEDAAQRHGHEPIVVDVETWPGEEPLTVTPGAASAVLEDEVSLDEITGAHVMYNQLFQPFLPRFSDQLHDDFVSTFTQLREYRGVFEGLLRILDRQGTTMVPPMWSISWHDRKPWQLHLFDDLDIPIPETIFTTDPAEVRQFVATHEKVIYKPVTNGGLPTVLTEEDLTDQRLQQLETAPVQFQEFVPGEDYRIYVVDGEIVGSMGYDCEHFSFKLDMDRGLEDELEFHETDPGAEMLADVRRATDAAGLPFVAADVRRRPDGSYALLELNHAPRFSVPDMVLDVGVADAVMAYLVSS